MDSRLALIVAVTVGVLGLPACGSRSGAPATPPGFPWTTDAGAIPDQSELEYLPCPGQITSVPLDESLLAAAAGAVEAGASDAPLSPPRRSVSPSGVSCIRLRVERDASNAIVSRRIVAMWVPKGMHHPTERVLHRVTVSDQGSKEELDADFDGVIDEISENITDGAGEWAGTVKTVTSGPAATPSRRWTTTVIDVSTVHVRREDWSGAGWALAWEDDVARTQQRCVTPADLPPPPPPPAGGGTCRKVPCTQVQQQKILDGMKSAMRKAENCAPFRIYARAVADVAAGLIEPACMTGSDCGYGETDGVSVATRTNKRALRINVDYLDSDQFMPTVWHEAIHIGLGAQGVHPEQIQRLAALLGKGLLVDRTYACEAMCFPGGAKPTRCDCAACLDDTTLPDGTTARATLCSASACSGLASCSCAQATGSYCARTKTFCDTVGECRAACAVNPDLCGRKDPRTNLYDRGGGNFSRCCNPACD